MSVGDWVAWILWALMGAGFVWLQTGDVGQSIPVAVIVVVWWARYEVGYRRGRESRT